MTRQRSLLTGAVAFALLALSAAPASYWAGDAKGVLKVCLISGSAEYKSDASLARLQRTWKNITPQSAAGRSRSRKPTCRAWRISKPAMSPCCSRAG